ncbi:hypothetical protein MN608_06042 [Microdochium nivale]|nr:hypothetical protein MN608_06042 [Microdochium nivale]
MSKMKAATCFNNKTHNQSTGHSLIAFLDIILVGTIPQSTFPRDDYKNLTITVNFQTKLRKTTLDEHRIILPNDTDL